MITGGTSTGLPEYRGMWCPRGRTKVRFVCQEKEHEPDVVVLVLCAVVGGFKTAVSE